jgi:DNA-binding transcriptional LysR family regulator
MNLDHLQLFAKVVQSGSFTGAADALETQKSYVSRVIAQLEAELGVKLLERTTRSIALTEVGREVYERAVGILGAVDDTRRVAQHAQGEPRGQLRLTCGVEFGLLAVGGWIDEYLARYPEVSVEAEYTSRVLDLVHEGFDLAVRIGEVQESRLVARRLGQLEYGLFATPEYLRRNGLPAEPAELREHALIMFSPGGKRAGWELALGPAHETRDVQRINGRARLRVNNSFAVRDAVLRGLGIGQLPLLVAAQPEIAARLLRVLPDWCGAPVPVHAVYPSNRYLSPKVRAFIDLALERLPQAADAARGAPIATKLPARPPRAKAR